MIKKEINNCGTFSSSYNVKLGGQSKLSFDSEKGRHDLVIQKEEPEKLLIAVSLLIASNFEKDNVLTELERINGWVQADFERETDIKSSQHAFDESQMTFFTECGFGKQLVMPRQSKVNIHSGDGRSSNMTFQKNDNPSGIAVEVLYFSCKYFGNEAVRKIIDKAFERQA